MWNNMSVWLLAVWGWVRNHLSMVAIAAGVIFVIFVFRGCLSAPAGPAGPTPGASWFFLKLAFFGLIVAAYAARENRRLAFKFSGLAVVVLLVLLGEFKGMTSWTVMGLPAFAAAAFWGAYMTDGRIRAFLAFAGGVIAITWFYMFAHAMLNIDTKFLGDRLTDDKLIILLLVTGLFVFAVWRRSRFFFLAAFIVLATWLETGIFDQIEKGFPAQLNPKSYVSQETKNTWERIWDSLLKRAEDAAKPGTSAAPAPAPDPAPAPGAGGPGIHTKEPVRTPLCYVGGDGSFERDGLIGIREGGHAFFATHALPWEKNAVFHVVIEVLRKTTGNICIEINSRGGQKFYNHPGSSTFSVDIFFETGERGDPRFFNPGPNQIKIWSPGAVVIIRCVRIEMIV